MAAKASLPQSIPPVVVAAMSGGVDSSVAAALALEAGARVIGVTLRFGPEGDAAVASARAVAEHLSIEHRVLDLGALFERAVLKACWDEYAIGRTPNPCARCNPAIKFGALLDEARRWGAGALVTGHHARLELEGGRPRLLRGRDRRKDQSYFLAMVAPERLAFARFPVGDHTKEGVRRLAAERGLPSASAPESQDTCVAMASGVGREGAFAETLRRRFGAAARGGEVVDSEGRVIGRHEGIHRFTIGQRRGLGHNLGRRAWVRAIDGDRARVVVTTRPEDLGARAMRVSDVVWHIEEPTEPLECLVQVRSRSGPVRAVVHALDDGVVFVDFLDAVSAVTPGQAAVLYRADRVVAAGWIAEAGPALPR